VRASTVVTVARCPIPWTLEAARLSPTHCTGSKHRPLMAFLRRASKSDRAGVAARSNRARCPTDHGTGASTCHCVVRGRPKLALARGHDSHCAPAVLHSAVDSAMAAEHSQLCRVATRDAVGAQGETLKPTRAAKRLPLSTSQPTEPLDTCFEAWAVQWVPFLPVQCAAQFPCQLPPRAWCCITSPLCAPRIERRRCI
jgi:hypothetical protein